MNPTINQKLEAMRFQLEAKYAGNDPQYRGGTRGDLPALESDARWLRTFFVERILEALKKAEDVDSIDEWDIHMATVRDLVKTMAHDLRGTGRPHSSTGG